MSMKLMCLLFPIVTGLAVCIGFHFLDKSRFAVKGVVAPYFTAIALIFALFASHTTVEVLQKVSRINSLLFTEASSIRGMLRISEPFDPAAPLVRHAVDKLLNELNTQEASSASSSKLGELVPVAFPELYRIAADPNNFQDSIAANTTFYDTLELFRTSWFERSELRQTFVR
jgi:hypothetical protein